MIDAVLAANRFGLGARPGEGAGASGDPAGWLLAGNRAFVARPAAVAPFSAGAAIAALRQLQAARVQEGTPAADAGPARAAVRSIIREGYVQAAAARLALAVDSETPFAERLVHVWSNHFALSVDKVQVLGLAGPFEFEAIRPHVLGRFSDLLLAVVRHPGMLVYLDQAQSAGPGSRLAQRAAGSGRGRRTVGLNENLAREILELHTLGVDGGYRQADVGALARAMTGWSVGGPSQPFQFRPGMHEGAAQTLLGKRYGPDGVGQAEAMLRDLAVHPATARHVSFRLARHFVADVPPAPMIERMAAAWGRTGGDLPAVYRAMLADPAAWDGRLAKFRTPWEWLVAALRGLGMPPDTRLLRTLGELGQPVWRPGSPAGFPDVTAHWAAPDALVRRVEVAARLAAGAAGRDARALAPLLVAGGPGPATRQAVARAEDGAQALALLLVSPEMLRR